jgi:opacity protein-like surface antigen
MKIKLLVAAAATVVASSAMAQSAFEGFYGQVGTGYEGNSVGSNNATVSALNGSNPEVYTAPNQSFGGAPLVIGLGYNFSIAPQWLLGLGVDYSLLSQTSSSYTIRNSAGETASGQSMKASDRFNIFLTPGYVIDKDKLVYLKAGYSSVKATSNSPTSYVDASSSGAISPALNNPSSTVGGYIIGLGYKQMITSGIYGFAEGNYMSYSKPSLVATNTNFRSVVNPSINSYQLLVGVGYKF